jgi:hypothetical protein
VISHKLPIDEAPGAYRMFRAPRSCWILGPRLLRFILILPAGAGCSPARPRSIEPGLAFE